MIDKKIAEVRTLAGPQSQTRPFDLVGLIGEHLCVDDSSSYASSNTELVGGSIGAGLGKSGKILKEFKVDNMEWRRQSHVRSPLVSRSLAYIGCLLHWIY